MLYKLEVIQVLRSCLTSFCETQSSICCIKSASTPCGRHKDKQAAGTLVGFSNRRVMNEEYRTNLTVTTGSKFWS